MEETTYKHNSKSLYFKDKFGNYQLIGQPEKIEYNRYICRVPILEIEIENPKNIQQYISEGYVQDKEEINLSEIKEKVLLPERYIINENACILFWKNGEKTIVKRCADDKFNPRLAFLTAFFQHYCGMSKNKANKYLASLQVEVKKEEPKTKPKHMKEETKLKFKVGDELIDNNGNKVTVLTVEKNTTCFSYFAKNDEGFACWYSEEDLKPIREEK